MRVPPSQLKSRRQKGAISGGDSLRIARREVFFVRNVRELQSFVELFTGRRLGLDAADRAMRRRLRMR